MRERTKLALLFLAFAGAYFLPVESPRVQSATLEGLYLLKDCARQHELLCLVPAFFIAGAIGQFVSQGTVLRYLERTAPPGVAYGVASISGSVLAVCSCTVLPLFASIYKRGAGLGPATAFLYFGPAINVLAMILTARVLGLQLGLARAIGARGLAHLRVKETDRLESLAENLRRLGAGAAVRGATLIIDPRSSTLAIDEPITTGSDHRLAMAFAVAGLGVPGVVIDDAACVSKSNPAFWHEFARLEGPQNW